MILCSPSNLRTRLEYASQFLNENVEIGSNPMYGLWSFCEIVSDFSVLCMQEHLEYQIFLIDLSSDVSTWKLIPGRGPLSSSLNPYFGGS
jgi:hypothetical protein